MNINATIVGEFIALFALAMAAMCYYLGRRKTQTPLLAALLGFILSIVPPFGLLYLIVLLFKKDIVTTSPAVDCNL